MYFLLSAGGSGPRKNPQSTSNLLVGEGTVSNTTEPVVCQNTDSFPKSGTTIKDHQTMDIHPCLTQFSEDRLKYHFLFYFIKATSMSSFASFFSF